MRLSTAMPYYLGKPPEAPVKPTTIFYYANEGDDAKAKVVVERKDMRGGYSRDATVFDGVAEPCTRVVVMPSVTGHHRAKIVAAYGDLVDKSLDAPAAEQVAAMQEAERNPPAPATRSVQTEPGRDGPRVRRGGNLV